MSDGSSSLSEVFLETGSEGGGRGLGERDNSAALVIGVSGWLMVASDAELEGVLNLGAVRKNPSFVRSCIPLFAPFSRYAVARDICEGSGPW